MSFMVGSVTVGNVPGAPGGVEVFIGQGAAQFTLTLFLLHHLKGDLREFRGGSEDAVGIELNFVHGSIIGIGESGSPPLVDSCSGEHVTRVEVFHVVDLGLSCLSHELADIPGEVLLEDTLTSDAEFTAQGVESALGGDALPTTVVDGHAVVIDLSDLVAVQVNSGHAVGGDDLGVLEFPVLVGVDGGDHLLFDLTHVWSCGLFGMYLV